MRFHKFLFSGSAYFWLQKFGHNAGGPLQKEMDLEDITFSTLSIDIPNNGKEGNNEFLQNFIH